MDESLYVKRRRKQKSNSKNITEASNTKTIEKKDLPANNFATGNSFPLFYTKKRSIYDLISRENDEKKENEEGKYKKYQILPNSSNLKMNFNDKPAKNSKLPYISLNSYDKGTTLGLSEDQLVCSGSQPGFRMVRATQCAYHGTYLYEAVIVSLNNDCEEEEDDDEALFLKQFQFPGVKKENKFFDIPLELTEENQEVLRESVIELNNDEIKTSDNITDNSSTSELSKKQGYVRIGWAGENGELQSFVGYDIHSFGYRDVDGSKIHARKRESNYGEPFKVGDVIGCYIKLNKNNPKENLIKFYKNGIDQGVAYEGSEIPSIGYYPAISIYNKAIVRVNFGPCFIENYNIEDVYSVSELQPLSHENKLQQEQDVIHIRNHIKILRN